MYLAKLSGVLDDRDFQRIYGKAKEERAALERRLPATDTPDCSPEQQADMARELVQRFLETAGTNRELLVSLVERVELTEDREIIIRFRFRQMEAIS